MNQVLTGSRDRFLVDVSLLVMRVIVGTIMAAHGAQKLFGVFGGIGMAEFAKMMGPVAYLVAIGEFFGGLGIVVGLLSRFSAASNLVIMLGAIAMVHGKNGFFLQNQGYEYNLALIGLLFPIVLVGPGRFTIGSYLPFPKSKHTGKPILFLE
ncbi:MAG: DoxX family protein [Planctomycetaceae bacterium]|nr:DoxX family protein [Planctomycetaceae bacterium]